MFRDIAVTSGKPKLFQTLDLDGKSKRRLPEYASTACETLDEVNYQGNAVVNYTDAETPYTRIIEHKHFEFGKQEKTVISREYSTEWLDGMEPFYPVNDDRYIKVNTRIR